MLIATATEMAAVRDLMNSPTDAKGKPWTEDGMVRAIINLVSELRENRKVHALVFGLGPRVHIGFGPFATADAAFNTVHENPVAYIAKRAAVVPIVGPGRAAEMLAMADEPPAEHGDFAIVREDAAAFKRGWDGKEKTKRNFLPAPT